MLKNSTPHQIALLVAMLITGPALLLLGVLLWLSGGFGAGWWVLLLFLPGLFFIAYYVTVHYLRRYIYRKIKLIYKSIHRHKVSIDQKSGVNMKHNIIEDVEREVADWAKEQQSEIERLRAWAEYRRRFLGDISHELKTPVFSIQGYLHTLLDGGLEDDTVARPFLEKAANNVQRLHTIIEDLSAISRLESGQLHLEMQAFDLKELTEEVFEELGFKAGKKGITLQLKEGANQAFKVRADRESIRQVLINLIHNSIKYGIQGGRTKVGFYDMDRYILIEVADNGIGIPEKHLPHVFDRFYRIDKSRSRNQGGSGLGLSIVKHLVEAHQQTINVRATPGLGATFGFTLEKA